MTKGNVSIRLGKEEYVKDALACKASEHILTCASNGLAKITEVSSYRISKRRAKGVLVMSCRKNVKFIGAIRSTGLQTIMLITSNSLISKVRIDNLKSTKGRVTSGVKLVSLKSPAVVKKIICTNEFILNEI
jgi:DNA gyrase subunit A